MAERIQRKTQTRFRGRHALKGLCVLVSAGPTVEDIDPVRFISNRSSGRMGVALAEAALEMGAQTVLVHGPLAVKLPRHRRLKAWPVRSAKDMYRAVLREARRANLVIMAAAVADFTPIRVSRSKIKKTRRAVISLKLKKTPDILAAVGRLRPRPVLVGFAAETDNLLAEARRKLIAKNCDLICANNVGERGSGFESATNRVTVIRRDGGLLRWPRASKKIVARRIVREAMRLLKPQG
jgi:phosphopantothenoylcysteine decarboxylase/phosphopantothenate--cysteine ligase